MTQPGGQKLLSGLASWYCGNGSACTRGYPPYTCNADDGWRCYAAAGPRIRAALGEWRGKRVWVTANGASVQLTLIDWCGCPNGRVLDLYSDVFAQLARNGLSQGIVEVNVTW